MLAKGEGVLTGCSPPRLPCGRAYPTAGQNKGASYGLRKGGDKGGVLVRTKQSFSFKEHCLLYLISFQIELFGELPDSKT